MSAREETYRLVSGRVEEVIKNTIPHGDRIYDIRASKISNTDAHVISVATEDSHHYTFHVNGWDIHRSQERISNLDPEYLEDLKKTMGEDTYSSFLISTLVKNPGLLNYVIELG